MLIYLKKLAKKTKEDAQNIAVIFTVSIRNAINDVSVKTRCKFLVKRPVLLSVKTVEIF